jgi:hypothetical protein
VDARATPKLVLHELAHGGLDLRFLVERRAPVAQDVCTAEKIDSCRLADLIEREDWKIG